ncbi:methyltransferase domain-containing protein [Deinococcus deserti]|uniref:Putative SAM dependent methyltransferase n=1 Tax=Deinococcus deserti (strain DSM 17065 / CIP 109153 / LMG 22923 / VCD115) TaxID=546414 RepID=C1CYR8_DEIDV|nr:methyltransferase domain-containing protein [Deinococcus deserti]ACO47098.2 putative SAM dependent methyltransferase [Deinococcus deserti VCD115]
MLPKEQAQHNAAVFGRLAATYDHLGFLAQVARHVAVQARVEPADKVLDVASGTGTVALELAARVGPSGQVVGTDLAPQMVEQARARAEGTAGLRFELADATALHYPDASFDHVVCASGLFFMPDMGAALREWRRVLRPGGTVTFSSFGPGLLGDLPGLWREDLTTSGGTPVSPPLGRLPTVEAARALLEEADFQSPEVTLDDLPYSIPSPEARWADIIAGLEGAPLASLDARVQEELREAHLQRLRTSIPGWPLTVSLPVIVARGRN